MAYYYKHIGSRIVFDPVPKDFDDIKYKEHDWKEFYPDIAQEPMPPNMPKPRGKPA